MPNHSTLSEGTDYRGNEDCHHDFDFDSLDSEEDQIKELQATGKTLSQIIQMKVKDSMERERATAICAVLILIQGQLGPEKRMMMIDIVSYACNFSLINGDTMESIAARHGISKQAVRNQVRDIKQQLKLCSRVERSEEGKTNMRNSNFRHMKTK
jgi:hypothetical protein